MNGRERFLETMRYGTPDRVPYFEEGLRPNVLQAWRKQGLKGDLGKLFPLDQREEVDLDVTPHPWPREWPSGRDELKAFARRFDPDDRSRLPDGWKKNLPGWKSREHVLMLRVHIGFFESLGVDGWDRLHSLIVQLHRDSGLVAETMRVQGECVAALTERVLQEIEIDAAVFSEPIGDNNGPLISPKMYKEVVLSSYSPILEVLRRHSVEVVILRTYANARALIPVLLEAGIGCLWACEVNTAAMDYRSLRAEFGRELRLIGGIDLDVLRQDREAIRREIEDKVPPLLAQSGYMPLADGRVRADIPFENYAYYRELLEKVTTR